MIDRYLTYLSTVRRYSPRTVQLYRDILTEYFSMNELKDIDVQSVRSYEIYLLDTKKESAKTVNLHLSVLSGFCKYLMKQGVLESNPVRLVSRPKQEKRLPVFYREDSMQDYFERTKGVLEYGKYEEQLERMILGLLYGTGIRRSELISLNRDSVDYARHVLRVRGLGRMIQYVLELIRQRISLRDHHQMKHRISRNLGHLDGQNDHAIGYQYDVIRVFLYQKHKDHLKL